MRLYEIFVACKLTNGASCPIALEEQISTYRSVENFPSTGSVRTIPQIIKWRFSMRCDGAGLSVYGAVWRVFDPTIVIDVP